MKKVQDMQKECVDLLESRGVTIQDIVDCVIFLQEPYIPHIREIDLTSLVLSVLEKREVQHNVLTGIYIDIGIENKTFSSSAFASVIANDEGLYGIDEVIAYGICNLYGSIASTNFGYIDKVKPGIIGKLNDVSHETQCNTFLDDIVGAIAAAAASKLAHSQ